MVEGYLSRGWLFDVFGRRFGGMRGGVSENTWVARRTAFSCVQEWWLRGGGFLGDREVLLARKSGELEVGAGAVHILWPLSKVRLLRWLSWMDGRGLSKSTVNLRLSCVSALMDGEGENLAEDFDVRLWMKEFRRNRRGECSRRAYALSAGELRKMLRVDWNRVIDHPGAVLRDRAAMMLCWGGALRAGELLALRWSDLRVVDDVGRDAVEVSIRWSKTDQYGNGGSVWVYDKMLSGPRGWPSRQPGLLGSLAKWRSHDVGAVSESGGSWDDSRKVVALHRWTLHKRMNAMARRAKIMVPSGLSFSTHSLRAGCASEAAENGVRMEVIQKHLRHKSADTTAMYCRRSTARSAGRAMMGGER